MELQWAVRRKMSSSPEWDFKAARLAARRLPEPASGQPLRDAVDAQARSAVCIQAAARRRLARRLRLRLLVLSQVRAAMVAAAPGSDGDDTPTVDDVSTMLRALVRSAARLPRSPVCPPASARPPAPPARRMHSPARRTEPERLYCGAGARRDDERQDGAARKVRQRRAARVVERRGGGGERRGGGGERRLGERAVRGGVDRASGVARPGRAGRRRGEAGAATDEHSAAALHESRPGHGAGAGRERGRQQGELLLGAPRIPAAPLCTRWAPSRRLRRRRRPPHAPPSPPHYPLQPHLPATCVLRQLSDTMMTRSIGDWDASRACIPEPECMPFEVATGDHVRVVLASDGCAPAMALEPSGSTAPLSTPCAILPPIPLPRPDRDPCLSLTHPRP